MGQVRDCLFVGSDYADDGLPPVLAIPGAAIPNRRRVIQYTGPARYLPRYATGCEACDNMPVGQMCEACDLEMTRNAASYRCQ